MSFGTTLKKIRLKHKDSLRGLAKKINLHFTFIDKVEKGTAPISNNFIERVIEVYPDEEKTLKKELKKTDIDSPLLAYDDYLQYVVYNSYKINYKDKDIKKIVQEVVNKALEERKTERGEA